MIPGYVHVDHFGNDSEYESGEDEIEYVTLDLVQAEPQLIPQTSSYRIAGLDTPTPFLQLQGTTFRGEHAELLGSEIIFTNGRGQLAQS
jgi:general transcription factor 3C polypeptide 6